MPKAGVGGGRVGVSMKEEKTKPPGKPALITSRLCVRRCRRQGAGETKGLRGVGV